MAAAGTLDRYADVHEQLAYLSERLTALSKQPTLQGQQFEALVEQLNSLRRNARPPPTLTNLPQEVRDDILQHLLHSQDVIRFSRCASPASRGREARRTYLSLLLTCKQLRSDAARVFFSTNKFGFGLWNQKSIIPFASHHVRLMKHVFLYGWKRLSSGNHVPCSVEISTSPLAMNIKTQIGGGDAWEVSEGEWKSTWCTANDRKKELYLTFPMLQAALPIILMLQQFSSEGSRMERETLENAAKMLQANWKIDLCDLGDYY